MLNGKRDKVLPHAACGRLPLFKITTVTIVRPEFPIELKSKGVSLSLRKTIWLGAVGAVLAAFAVAAVVLPKSYQLAAICDMVDALLLASGAAAFLALAVRSRGRMRFFWSLISVGVTMWFSYQLMWTYFEVVLHRDVPELFAGDVVLFLDIVPLMAALALRPHAPQDEYAARLGRLDFILLLVWWLYLYVLIVIPWQYVEANNVTYTRDLDSVYFVEKIAFLAGLVVCWLRSQGHWRSLYRNLFGMMFTYIASSTIANLAIARKVYYSGSLYDVPLALAMAWLTWIGLSTGVEEPRSDGQKASTIYGVWVSRCGMIAVFSLPLFAAWAMSNPAMPPRVRMFRLALTLAAAFAMGVMVLVRQRLLDRELISLLNHSRDSFDSLKHLQTQILQSEKLASIGQLVGGAAHELNNPITAMLGYSDLLLSTKLTAEQQPLAAKIGQHVRRTKSLVASLISFARQTTATRTPLDLNTLARTAVKLSQPQWEPLGLKVHTEFDADLPRVLGDSNQLLQVCLQLVGNCVHALSERGSGTLSVCTERHAGTCVLEITTDGVGSNPPATDSGTSTNYPEGSLGLSACQGIVQEHRGQVTRERRQDGALVLRVELPATDPVPVRAKEATVPVLWQSQPYA
jgi:signal transduction histidine kinase